VVGFGGVSNLHFCCYWWRGITYWSNCAGLRCWYPAQLPFTVNEGTTFGFGSFCFLSTR